VETYRKLQKPNTYNYNIVLFDGDAFSDSSNRVRDSFRAFDFNNCTIISDRANERYIRPHVSRAKVIYTKKYTDELLTNIKNTLTRAFR
jgi:5-formaminoimidazole-4-carboxamide-1-beta-D-ribofuranosyl 5'-monophosphate synthetase